MGNLKNFVKLGKKIVGAAVNYKSVVQQNKLPTPTKPIVFLKPSSSYITEGQTIIIPDNFAVSQEAELGVIIGKTCQQVDECEAMQFVGGYCLALDMTATSELAEARKNGLSWFIGKGFDTSCPVSRFIDLEEIPDPDDVDVWCKVNGEQRQCGNTNDLIFTIPQLISYITKYVRLDPYDLILTGTPLGNLPVKRKDVIEAGIGDLVKIEFPVE